MVFHDIESITSVNDGRKIIIYLIESDQRKNLPNSISVCLKSILESLEKKNDDILLVKVLHNSEQFKHFQYIYKLNICVGVTLFAVNNEGIPITSSSIANENEICQAINLLTENCGLKSIPNIESLISSITKNNLSPPKQELKTNEVSAGTKNVSLPQSDNLQPYERTSESTAGNSSTSNCKPSENGPSPDVAKQNLSRLQLRLPDGSKDVQQFDKKTLLEEVRNYLISKHKIRDFDLKTFNHLNFSEDEYKMNLQDLSLHPSGVIIVVLKNVVDQNRSRWIDNILHSGFQQLVTSTTNFVRYVQNMLFTMWTTVFASPNAGGSSGRSIQSQNTNSEATKSQKPKKYEAKPYGSNIHTLRRNDDNDDENNRYNGNSTQQK